MAGRVRPGWVACRPRPVRSTIVLVLFFGTLGSQLCVARSEAHGVRYSRLPLATEPSTPCPPAEEGEAECELIVPAAEGPEAEEATGTGEKGGFDPQDLHAAYNLPETGGSGRTIALVDAFNNPKAEADLAVYRERYGLSECTEVNGCFKKVNQLGEVGNYPESGRGWTGEISLDLDMASAACPECKLLLVEANNEERASMDAAEEAAVGLGATVVSNSWNFGFETAVHPEEKAVGPEETSYDHFFNHPGIPILFSGGDYGYAVRYPAASQYTIAVGGTRLAQAPETERGWVERVWSNPEDQPRERGRGTGSGCSEYEAKPLWQPDFGCHGRIETDVAAVADPSTPVSTYNTNTGEGFGWRNVGGTSAAAPFVAGVVARSSAYSISLGPEAFYSDPGALNDVTEGNNGTCTPPSEDGYWCTAGIGYDGPTGLGTPNGTLSVAHTPLATTKPVSGLTKSSAALNGAVNPHGHETTYHFEYGETTSYGTSTPSHAAGEGNISIPAGQTITALQPGTVYHYRVVATNSEGTSYGADRTFTPSGWGLIAPAPLGEVKRSSVKGVACASSSICVGVGEWQNSEGVPAAATERWNGSQWSVTRIELPEGARESVLRSTSCVSASACWAVGDFVTDEGKTEALAEVWNGTSWEEQAVVAPKESKMSVLRSVSCASTTVCVAVGEYINGEGKLLGLADTLATSGKWKSVATAPPTEAKESALTAISCASTTVCVADGWDAVSAGQDRPLAELWSSKKWTSQLALSPAGAEKAVLQGIACTATNNCTAAGFYVGSEAVPTSLLEQWNGTSWQIKSVSAPAGATKTSLSAVACVSSADCTAVGSYQTSTSIPLTLAEHWNGSEWQPQATPNPSGATASELQAVACPATGACTATGASTDGEGTAAGLIEWVTGGEWQIATPAPLGEVKRSSVKGVACASSSICVGVGEWQNSEGVPAAATERWNGSQWSVTRIELPEGARESVLRSTSCVSASACWAVGDFVTDEGKTEALAEVWNGTSWEEQAVVAPKESKMSVLRSVSCASTTVCVAVGEYINGEGKLLGLADTLATSGKWKSVATAPPTEAKESALTAISCASTTVCVADGWDAVSAGQDRPLAELWSSKKWTSQLALSPAGAEKAVLQGIACTATNNCTAAGFYVGSEAVPTSLLEQWNGTSWQIKSVSAPAGATKTSLSAVACVSSADCTAVGSYQTSTSIPLTLAEHWNGSEWQPQATPNPSGATASELQAVACPATGACTATGASTDGEGTAAGLIEETP